eukprot:scaffold1499_cov255-Pinguiococcus_pyrenoidosus.AAC.13
MGRFAVERTKRRTGLAEIDNRQRKRASEGDREKGKQTRWRLGGQLLLERRRMDLDHATERGVSYRACTEARTEARSGSIAGRRQGSSIHSASAALKRLSRPCTVYSTFPKTSAARKLVPPPIRMVPIARKATSMAVVLTVVLSTSSSMSLWQNVAATLMTATAKIVEICKRPCAFRMLRTPMTKTRTTRQTRVPRGKSGSVRNPASLSTRARYATRTVAASTCESTQPVSPKPCRSESKSMSTTATRRSIKSACSVRSSRGLAAKAAAESFGKKSSPQAAKPPSTPQMHTTANVRDGPPSFGFRVPRNSSWPLRPRATIPDARRGTARRAAESATSMNANACKGARTLPEAS